MNKTSKPLFAGTVVSYFKKEYTAAENNYYTQRGKLQGQWFGRLANEWGLIGAVSEEEFAKLAHNLHPKTGAQLIEKQYVIDKQTGQRHERPLRSAWDVQIGSTKSVSIAALVGGDHRILEAHRTACKEAFTAAEHYVQAHLGNNRGKRTTGKMVAAMFEHDAARETIAKGYPDPHLHTHLVMFNVTVDGKTTRALETHEIFKIQTLVSAIYHSRMSRCLKELGYGREFGRNYSIEIKGFSRDYLDAASSRTLEIEAEKQKRGVFGAEADEIIAHQDRIAKRDWEPEALRHLHKMEATMYGNDPVEIVTEAQSRARNQAIGAEDVGSLASQSIDFAKHRLSERTAVFDHFEIMRDALRYGQGDLVLPEVQAAFERKRADFVNVSHYRATAPGERLTTPSMLRMERECIEAVKDSVGTVAPVVPEGWTKDTFRGKFATSLNGTQKHLVWNSINCQDRIFEIQGSAGTGKTTSLKPLADVYESQGYEVFGLAATSGAVKELRSIGIKAETIQAFLQHGPRGQTKHRVYVFDEAGLADTKQFWRFLKDYVEKTPDDRAIFVGDVKQHQSIGPGRIFEELRQAGTTTFRLDKIVRQKSEELKGVVYDFARGDTVTGLRKLDRQGRIHVAENRDNRFEAIAKDYLSSDMSTLIISPDNASRRLINDVVREQRRKQGDIGPDVYRGEILINRQDIAGEDTKLAATYNVGDVIRYEKRIRSINASTGDYAVVIDQDRDTREIKVKFESDGREQWYNPSRTDNHMQIFVRDVRSFAKGDLIQFTTPWKIVANRDIGVIEEIDHGGNVKVRLEDSNQTVRFNLSQMRHVDYGIAITSYSAQGKTRDRVLLHIEGMNSQTRNMVDKILLYVGGSRPQYDLQIYTDNKGALEKQAQRLALKPKALSHDQIKAYDQTSIGVGA